MYAHMHLFFLLDACGKKCNVPSLDTSNFPTQRTAWFCTLACIRAHAWAGDAMKGKFDERWCYNLRESSRNRARELPWNIRFTLRWIPMSNIKGRERFRSKSAEARSARSGLTSLSFPLSLSLSVSLLPFSFSFSPLFLFLVDMKTWSDRGCGFIGHRSDWKEKAANAKALIQRWPARRRIETLRSMKYHWPNSRKRILIRTVSISRFISQSRFRIWCESAD